MIAVEDSRGFVMARGPVSVQSKTHAVFMDVEANNVARDV
jgi:hypothetical protein